MFERHLKFQDCRDGQVLERGINAWMLLREETNKLKLRDRLCAANTIPAARRKQDRWPRFLIFGVSLRTLGQSQDPTFDQTVVYSPRHTDHTRPSVKLACITCSSVRSSR